MIAYDLLSVGKTVPRHDILGREQMLKAEPGLASEGLVGAARYFDAQITFAERLVLENLLAAKAAGARLLTHTVVHSINIDGDRVTSIDCTDAIEGTALNIRASAVINAAGPWVDAILDTAAHDVPRLIGGTKGSHIVVGRFDGAPDEAFYVEARADGRPFFVIPWNQLLLSGTTDIRYRESLDEIRASRAEIDYLLSETNLVFPSADLEIGDIHYAYAGIRPLPYRKKGPESAITRKHIIKKHRRVARGLLSIVGGKLTTYRNLAEEVTDRVARRLTGSKGRCVTATGALPGAMKDMETVDQELRQSDAIGPESREHLVAVYGGRALLVKTLVDQAPALGAAICPHSHAIGAEIVFAVESEMATSLADVLLRRTMIGLSPDQGRAALPSALQIARDFLGWSDARIEEEERMYLREIDRLRV